MSCECWVLIYVDPTEKMGCTLNLDTVCWLPRQNWINFVMGCKPLECLNVSETNPDTFKEFFVAKENQKLMSGWFLSITEQINFS